jgi:hypothetical protein
MKLDIKNLSLLSSYVPLEIRNKPFPILIQNQRKTKGKDAKKTVRGTRQVN